MALWRWRALALPETEGAITPCQAVVFYDQDVVVGGGLDCGSKALTQPRCRSWAEPKAEQPS
jgi:tRNA(5-methylaminomethyl-2-thiouridine)-methyltransferase-like protein